MRRGILWWFRGLFKDSEVEHCPVCVDAILEICPSCDGVWGGGCRTCTIGKVCTKCGEYWVTI